MPPKANRQNLTISRCLIAGFLFFTLSGCGKEEAQYVEVKEVKESPAATAEHVHTPGDGHDHGQEAAPAGPGFTYDVPDGWSVKAPSRMVLLAFQIGQPPETMADMAASAFPGDVGGQLANINRWRRQVGLGPVDPEAAKDFITELEVSGLPAWQVSFTGPLSASKVGEPVRMVVTAVFHDGKTWFFKLVGAESAVAGEMQNYGAFLKTLKF
jgi:hypothetical protein